jgi:all-trans-8'-apo-beta-carotenal 15,15'-oxygenase
MVAATKAASDDLEWGLWTRNLTNEHGFVPLNVEGTLPTTLRGTLFRNGPGQFEQFGSRYSHPFEADGAVTAIRIANGTAMGAAKITRTTALSTERGAGEIMYGTSAPWSRRILNNLRGRRKNNANTSVMIWQDRLFALMEAGKPTELSPRDLRFLGEQDLGGVVGGMFSAHPHYLPAHRSFFNFGLEYGRVTKLHVYALPDVGPARELTAIALDAPPMLHDFIATETHLIFFISPVRVNVKNIMLALGDFNNFAEWKPEHGTEVICVPIANPDQVVRFHTNAFFQWHFANAHTRGRELVIDYVRYPTFDTFYELGKHSRGDQHAQTSEARYHRATVDLGSKTLRSEQLSDRECEFPQVAQIDKGRDHALAYATFDRFGAIGSIDRNGKIVAHALPANQRATEPLVVDGHLLSLCHERDRAFVAVYDAARIPNGPVAKIWIDHHVPITFHGVFDPR